jgi:ABC-type ATPase involved in cell division
MSEFKKFLKLQLEGWRQFDFVDIDMHPRLTVITGANGSGKSTLLNVLSSQFGWSRPYLSVPKQDQQGVLSYVAGIFASLWKNDPKNKLDQNNIGSLTYSNNSVASLHVPAGSVVEYGIDVRNQQRVLGIHVDSYRPIPRYQTVTSIPLQAINPDNAYQMYHSELWNRYQGGHSGFSPMFKMKEVLISWAIFGEGNAHIQRNDELTKHFSGFVDILRKLLPESLGFLDIAIRKPEIVLRTKTGDFMIDSASGGIMTLIDIAWRIYVFSISKPSFVVTMDEPENHLHPSMQRSLMRRLLDAFPGAQFVIATHSPFMVSSVKDSNVYVLRYRDASNDRFVAQEGQSSPSRRFVSEQLDTINKASNAGEILRSVLGVPATIPEWVEDDIERIISNYRQRTLSNDVLNQLRAELNALGYGEAYPTALGRLISEQ